MDFTLFGQSARPLVPVLSCMMASHLFVALAGGGLLLQAGALEQGVLAELAAHGYERFLQVPFFILGLSVVEKA